MRTALAGTAACLAAALLATGCPPAGPRAYAPQASNALPELDPAARGTAQAQQVPISEYEQVAVRMGRDPSGRPVVLSVLSPALTPEQQEEVRRAFGRGEWKRQAPIPTEAETWIETIVRAK